MKAIFLLALIVISFSATAEVRGSKFEAYQQNMITEVVAQQCGISSDLFQVSHTEVVDQIDNGISDVYMTTVFEAKVRTDQMIFDSYLVKVNSVLADAYDHSNQVWGIFTVQNVTCYQN